MKFVRIPAGLQGKTGITPPSKALKPKPWQSTQTVVAPLQQESQPRQPAGQAA